MKLPNLIAAPTEDLAPASGRAAAVSGRQPKSSRATGDLDFHASGFVAKVEGAWDDGDLAQFLHLLKLHQLTPTEEELGESLQRARQDYWRGDRQLLLCAAHPCCKACNFDTSDAGLAEASQMAGLPIARTGCQGRCKHAPVLSLRIDEQTQGFTHVANGGDWLAVLGFVKGAVSADSLLINPGDAEPFLYDPVHEAGKPDVHLRPLHFLQGHFRGEGRFAMSGYRFQKEVVGTLEAGGRFLALRMSARYPLADGRHDTHRALVIAGPKSASGTITGLAYTDDGSTHEYEVERQDQMLRFPDALPDHNGIWKCSRKVLLPTEDGFEERLEVDAGDGFTTYYTIAMHRVIPS